ncbi:MAG: bifunctional ornithine acetyltransferase/N-acetylglutamate synthase [Alphaproteobacteria bacterium]|nr:MAG: bifunctional ornithine acetyltransferase/N-acetylglutamate synthase [Alphaproteobacteria bacterium]
MTDISPLAPERFPELAPIAGVRLAAFACGIRYTGRDDLMLAELAPDSAIAGVFTRSLTAGAPVVWCRDCLSGGKARGIVVNSGNSNTFTGRAGREVVEATAAATARLLGCDPKQVFISSTGVIGEPPAAEKIIAALPQVMPLLSAESWESAARAIMTTDTFPKGATATANIDGVEVRLNGFATVDGDTSTSDTVLLCATQQAPHRPVASPADRRLGDFRRALDAVMIDLAQQIVRDGEGAGKFVTIEVTRAATARAARRIGLTIGNSPLVKTALSAGDPNWGRIVMAVGRAGEKVDQNRLSISIGGIPIAAEGGPVPNYDEAPVAEYMKGREITIGVDLGIGRGKATVWTCDLTHEYIDINASYRS